MLAAFDLLHEALVARRDAEGTLALFVADDDIVMWGSGAEEVALGSAEVGELVRSIAASPQSGSLSFHWRRRLVRIEGDIAWVNAVGEFLEEKAGGGSEAGPYRVTAIFVRRDGAWRWHTHSGSEPSSG